MNNDYVTMKNIMNYIFYVGIYYKMVNYDFSKTIVCKIHRKNCGYCIQMEPEWEKMKDMMKGGKVDIHEFETSEDAEDLKKFNAELKNKFNKELEYDGVPTLARISGGNINYYKGERKAEQMKKWALNEKKGGKKTKKYNSKKFRKGKKRTLKKCGWFF